MYISYAGIPAGELVKQGGFGGTFVTDFKTTYGHDPASFYSIYGAAATQVILAAIAKSDGTRKSVTEAAFSGITIPADQSILGKQFGIDKTGDVTVKDMSFNVMKNNNEQFLKPWPLDG
jgi:branched-chain amino acid transport system substrate-binding protein